MASHALPQLNQQAFSRVKSFLFLSGVLTKANGVFLVVHQGWFGLNHFQTMLAPMCFFLASLFISPIAGGSLQHLGFRKGMTFALLMALFACLSISATHYYHSYFLFLSSIFLLGMAVKSMLITGAAYAMVVGPEPTQSGRLVLGQGFYSLGGLLTPIIFFLCFNYFPAGEVKVIWGAYAFFALISAAIIISFYLIPRFPVREGLPGNKNRAFFPKFTKPLILAFLVMFMYMGMEVCLDSLLVKFLTTTFGKEAALKYSVALFSIYYLGFVVGRFCGSRILNKIPLHNVLIYCAATSLVLFVIGISFHGVLPISALLLCGLSNSVLYPSIIAIGVQEVAQDHSKVTGFISMAAIGGALFPPLQGLIADHFGLRVSFYLLLIPFAWVMGHGLYVRSSKISFGKEKLT
jgi:MFS transporter, FHS family, L-fucose permease